MVRRFEAKKAAALPLLGSSFCAARLFLETPYFFVSGGFDIFDPKFIVQKRAEKGSSGIFLTGLSNADLDSC